MMVAVAESASAQITAEEIMGLLPKMPTEAEMITYQKESTAPIGDDKVITQPKLYDYFMESLKQAKAKADESLEQAGNASIAKTRKSKVAGTDYTVEDVENMSEAEQEKMAMAMAQKKLASMGISLSDLPQTNPKLAELQLKLAELNSEESRLVMTIDDPLKAAAEEGRNLYAKDYQAKIDALETQKRSLTYAYMEKFTDEDRPRVEAESKKARELTLQQWELESDFYAKYIPKWRKAILASMDFCKKTIIPLQKQRQDITRQLYELTQDANYTMSDTYPLVGAVGYLEQSGKLGSYDDYLKPQE